MEHLTTLKYINYIYAALFGLGAVIGGMALVGLSIIPLADGEAGGLIMTFGGLGLAFVLGLFALLHLVVGKGVENGRFRITQTILAVLNVSNFPLGMAYGVYALWVCWANDETKAAFANPYS